MINKEAIEYLKENLKLHVTSEYNGYIDENAKYLTVYINNEEITKVELGIDKSGIK